MPKSILLIDEDPEEVSFLAKAITEIGIKHVIRTASDGSTALDVLQQPRRKLPELIVWDMKITMVEGLTMLVSLKKKYDIKILIYTSSFNEEAIKRFKKLGAFDCIRKGTSYSDSMNFAKRVKDILSLNKNQVGTSGSS